MNIIQILTGTSLVAFSMCAQAATGFSVSLTGMGQGMTPTAATNAASAHIRSECTNTYGGGTSISSSQVYSSGGGAGYAYAAVAFGSCTYSKPDPPFVYAFNKSTSPTQVSILDWDSDYEGLRSTYLPSSAGGTDESYQFAAADYDKDGIEDLFLIKRSSTGSGTTEVHIINGANPASYLLQTGTALTESGTAPDYKFVVADSNHDDIPDIYVIKKNGGSGTTEVHILDGASKYQNFSGHFSTALAQTGGSYAYDFLVADFNHDDYQDLYAIQRNGASGTIEAHILSGRDNFQTYLKHAPTPLPKAGLNVSWDFGIGDYDYNNIPDLYAFQKDGSKLVVYVLDGLTFEIKLETTTPLSTSGAYASWRIITGQPH